MPLQPISHFIERLHTAFTLLKNSEFHPNLRDRINGGAIVAP
jgi:hypothetical protein